MVEVGQVLSLRLRLNQEGVTAEKRHPYIVVDINKDYVEIAQFDSLRGKEHKAAFKGNVAIMCDEPQETVIDQDSFVQIDNEFRIENFPELERFRRQPDKLSEGKLRMLLDRYKRYRIENTISDNKRVYTDQDELLHLNSV